MATIDSRRSAVIALSTGIALAALAVLALFLYLVGANLTEGSTSIPAAASELRAAAQAMRSAGAESADTQTSVASVSEAADAHRRPVTGTVTGSVQLPDGSPGQLYVFCEPVDAPPLLVEFQKIAERDGSFRFDRLLPGRYRVLAALTPLVGYRYSEPFTIEAGRTAALPPIVMEPEPIAGTGAEPPALSGRLWLRGRGSGRDRDTHPDALRPLLGVTRVLAFDDNGHGTASVTDREGNFAFVGLAPGPYTILVGQPDYRAYSRNRVTAPRRGLEVVAVSGTSGITGRVRDQSGTGLRRFHIAVFERHGERTFQRGRATGSRGRYGIQKLPPGAWDLRFEADGCEPHVERLDLEARDCARVDVVLHRDRAR